MAKVYWTGEAVAVAQVHTGSIDSVDATPANNDFTVTIGGVAITTTGDTDVATTAAALVASLNGSTHPYFSTITWTNPSAGNIVGTADTAGVPFVAALTETGAGTGTVTDFASTTANAGPNAWDSGDNWSSGSIPAASDDVYIDQDSVVILWGLDQNTVTPDSLHIRRDAKIGLNTDVFATDSDGTTTSAYPEYRQAYLKINADVVRIGEHLGPGAAVGSQRVMVHNNNTTASVTEVFNTASTASESGKPAVRLLFDDADADLDIRSARAGVGVAVDQPGETSTVGEITVSDVTSVSRLFTGDGVTATSVLVLGGISRVNLAATLATMTVNGGTVTIEGDQVITALNVNAGLCKPNNRPVGGGVGVTTCTQNSGEVDWNQSLLARTVTTYNYYGGTRKIGDHLTITNDNRSGYVTEISQ